MLFIVTLLACGSGSTGGSPQGAKVVHHDAAASHAFLLEHPDTVVVDVRTPAEFAAGHLDGAVNLDLSDTAFAEHVAKLPRDKPILVHCAVGGRSTASLPAFADAGLTDVHHMDGGLRAWTAGGLPVVK